MRTSKDTHTSDAPALLTLPSLTGLAEAQVRGANCVWCAIVLTPATATDLGPRPIKRAGGESRWFPRGCKTCTSVAASRTLDGHRTCCEQCVDDAGICDTALGLRRLMRRGRRP